MSFRFLVRATLAVAIVHAAAAQEDPLPPGAAPPPPPKATPVPAQPAGPVPVRGGGGAYEVNGIAATVNGKAVTKNEVFFMLAPVAAQLAAQFPRRGEEFDKRMSESRDTVLQELIDRELILFEFKNELKGSLPDRVVDEEIKRQVREMYNGNEDTLREELKKARMTMDGYRQLTKDKLIVQAMRAREFSDAPPPLPSEVEAEYNEVKTKLRDTAKDKITFKKIFIPRATDDPAATADSQLALAEDLAKQIQAGSDFAELAKQHSADAFAAEGGQWPADYARADLSPEFAAILFDAETGKLIGPLEDANGFTLAVVTEKNLGPPPPLAEVREEIEERVTRKKTAARYERWITRLRENGMIKRRM